MATRPVVEFDCRAPRKLLSQARIANSAFNRKVLKVETPSQHVMEQTDITEVKVLECEPLPIGFIF